MRGSRKLKTATFGRAFRRGKADYESGFVFNATTDTVTSLVDTVFNGDATAALTSLKGG